MEQRGYQNITNTYSFIYPRNGLTDEEDYGHNRNYVSHHCKRNQNTYFVLDYLALFNYRIIVHFLLKRYLIYTKQIYFC